MHIWYLENWKEWIDLTKDSHRSGLRMRFDAEVDIQIKEVCKNFAKWLRKEFFFPIRVYVYIKALYRIKARDGEFVVGTFLWPADYDTEPHIRIAAGDYQELKKKRGEEEAMWAILESIAHELTHYFQYVNGISLTKMGDERQATMYSDYILSDYDEYLEKGKVVKSKKDIWKSYRWEENINFEKRSSKMGMQLKFDSEIDSEVRKVCKAFAAFLRKEYFFPIRLQVCVKKTSEIIDADGNKVISTLQKNEDDYTIQPRIFVAVGKYAKFCSKWGREEALKNILITIGRELTYYFQWINAVELTPVGKKRQATRYARKVVNEFIEADKQKSRETSLDRTTQVKEDTENIDMKGSKLF